MLKFFVFFFVVFAKINKMTGGSQEAKMEQNVGQADRQIVEQTRILKKINGHRLVL